MSNQQPLQFQLINAFAATPRAGNQAAVVLIPKEDPRATDEAYMQAVAKDFNLSETAYLVPLGSTNGVPKYGLRWFTPTDVGISLPHVGLALMSRKCLCAVTQPLLRRRRCSIP